MQVAKKYARSRFKELRKQLKYFKKTSAQEALHQVRVELKKLHSIYALIAFCNKKFKCERNYKALRKIMHKAGPIRNAEVIKQLFEGYKIELPIKDALYTEREYAQQLSTFKTEIPSYQKSIAKSEKKLKYWLSEIKPKCIKEFISNTKSEISKKAHSRIIEQHLHHIRIQIKQLIYISQIEGGLSSKTLKQYDALQNSIGNWHNKIMLYDFLKEVSFDLQKNNIKKLLIEIENELVLIDEMITKIFCFFFLSSFKNVWGFRADLFVFVPEGDFFP